MREIFIKYNPYQLATEITIDGEQLKKNSKLNFEERRLQEWVEMLPQLLFEECNTRDFKIIFHGTLPDYEDMVAMVQEAKKNNINIELEHISAKEVKDKECAIQEIFDEIQKGPFDELRQADVIKAFNMARSSDFEVNVVATMSAGKSTLINSLLRQKLMPAKQEACTATITEIRDNDGNHFEAKVFDKEGNLIQTQPELTYNVMKQLNEDKNVSRIRAEGNIPFVTADDVRLVLVDTPGPNNARDPEHMLATYRMLSESSKTVVLYIMNATQLGVEDDASLLKYVSESMRVGGKQSRDRFIFVVNKLDEFIQSEDDIQAAINKVVDYLRDNGIENPNIYPASALTALNIRTILSEDPVPVDFEAQMAQLKLNMFNATEKMYFENYAPLTPSVRGEIANLLAQAKDEGDVKTQGLIHTGIIPIEMAIKMYVQKYAKTAKIKNIVDTFAKKLESAKSFEITKQEIASNQDMQKEILAQIDTINKKLANGENAKKFKDEIAKINYDNEIRKLANSVITEAQDVIGETLENQTEKMTKSQAEDTCRDFKKLADRLQAEVQVKLEDLCSNHIKKNAEDLLEQYKKKIAELSQDMNIGNVDINPFEIMEGSIGKVDNIEDILREAEKSETVKEKVGEHKEYKEVFGLRRWLNEKIGTSFNVDFDWVDDYDWVEKQYIDGTMLAQKFFAPIQKSLFETQSSAMEYAKNQTKKIKSEFSKKFEQLDKVLKNKLNELEQCARDNENIELRIKESEDKLSWLEDIQDRVNQILDI